MERLSHSSFNITLSSWALHFQTVVTQQIRAIDSTTGYFNGLSSVHLYAFLVVCQCFWFFFYVCYCSFCCFTLIHNIWTEVVNKELFLGYFLFSSQNHTEFFIMIPLGCQCWHLNWFIRSDDHWFAWIIYFTSHLLSDVFISWVLLKNETWICFQPCHIVIMIKHMPPFPTRKGLSDREWWIHNG